MVVDAMICDFCGYPNTSFSYETSHKIKQVYDGKEFEYSKRWQACVVCSSMISKNDRRGLARRSLESNGKIPRIKRRFIYRRIRDLHEEFLAMIE